ncbi:MAG: hypothetical protein M0Q88_00215 [Bacilli bacterium]|nr:hypothetical protein [Bacilli bacterium]
MEITVNGKEIEVNVDGVYMPKRKKSTDFRHIREDGSEYPQYDVTIRLVSNTELNGYEKECLTRRIRRLLSNKE